jgi:ABC-type multidrug transport system fused ATPase/permease subunit
MDEQEQPITLREGEQGIWRHVREYRGALWALVALGLVSAAANGAVPYITGRFFDALIGLSRGEPLTVGGLPLWAAMLALWALVRIVSDSVDWWADRRRRWLYTNAHLKIQAEGFSHLLQLPLAFHAQEHINEIFSRLGNASWRISATIDTATDVAPQLLSIVVGITLAYTINATLASVLVGGVAAYTLALLLILRGMAAKDSDANRLWNDSWNDAAAAVSQATAVKQAAAETYEIDRIRRSMRGSVVSAWYANELSWNRVNLWQRITVSLTQLGVFILSVHYVSTGALTVGELVALNGYALMFFGPLVSLGHSWQNIQNGVTTAGLLERIFTRATENYRGAGKTGEEPAGRVHFEHVSFRYGDDQAPVLDDCSFSAEPGQVIALVGESGVGKSSAVSLISGYYFPSAGQVLVDGVDTREWDLTALRSRIAVVPQENALFNDTIRTNIRYGAFDASDEAVEHAAREAHIHDFITKQAEGYDTLVGERGIRLSVGQKQRIAIARAILRDPEILILDEPTSALDIETEQLITASLEKLMTGRTTFIIAHRLSTVRAADKILVIKDGRVAEDGTHAELATREDSIYRRLYELHVGLHE